MNSKPIYDVLIDSDAFVGWFWAFDGHHQEATERFRGFEAADQHIVTTNLVVLETATVLSYRVGQDAAKAFLHHIDAGQLPIIRVDEQIEGETVAIFQQQTKKGISMVDCSNVAVVRLLTIPAIFSFDHFYEHLGLRTIPNEAQERNAA